MEIICGQGVAPRLATREWFVRHKDGQIPAENDPTTAAIPGAPDAMLVALDRFGTKTFGEVAQPVLEILEGPDRGLAVEGSGLVVQGSGFLPSADCRLPTADCLQSPEIPQVPRLSRGTRSWPSNSAA